MPSFSKLIIIAALFVHLAEGVNASTFGLYAIGPFDTPTETLPPNDLFLLNQATGEATPVGNTGLPRFVGLTRGPGGRLLGLQGATVFEIDTQNGSVAPIVTANMSGIGEGAIAYDESSGLLYVLEGSLIYWAEFRRVNLATGEADSTRIDLRGNDISGAAFDAFGQLYILTRPQGGPDTHISSVDITTGGVSLVANLGALPMDGTGGLDFDPETNIAYFTNGSDLYSISLPGGDLELIGSTGVSRLAGMAFVIVPEPNTVTLAFLAASLLVFTRKLRTTAPRD